MLDGSGLTKDEVDFLERFDVWKQDNGIWFYEPIPKVVPFHECNSEWRLLHGANRSSKSYSGAAEDVWYSTGLHPYKDIKTPNEGWVVSLSFKQQVEGVQPLILKLLPKDNIKKISYIKGEVIDTIWVIPGADPDPRTDLRNCSKITFKSSDQGERLFAGAGKRWIHFDEECSYKVWKESIARIAAGVPLQVWMTMTPIFEEEGTNRKVGMTWSYKELYCKRDGERISTFGVGIEDNIYLSKEQIESQKKKYHGAEYDIRIKGEFRLLAGNQVFDPEGLEKQERLTEGHVKKGRLEYEGRKVKFVEDDRGYLKIWQMPKHGDVYGIGSDIGLGTGGDPSAATVRLFNDLSLGATVHGQIPPDVMGDILKKLGIFYNQAWIGIEANSFGQATINEIKGTYHNLYYRYKRDQRTDKRTKQLGWWTDTKSKGILISDYGRAIRELALIIGDRNLLEEAMTYVIDGSGSSNAEAGCHDDLLIADMITYQVYKQYHHSFEMQAMERYKPSNQTAGY